MRWMLVIFLALAGCTSVDTSLPDDVPETELPDSGLLERTPDTCGLSEHDGLVGQPLTAFDPASRDRPVRVVRPGQIVTNEYNPQRMNIDLDGQDQIKAIRCG